MSAVPSAPVTPEWSRSVIGRIGRPSYTNPGHGQRARHGSYWNDTPTGKGRDDFKRGRDYAALTMAAIGAESCASWDLERIIEAIVIDAASRKAKGGKYSRTLPPAVYGFIHELSRQFCAKVTGSQP